MKKLEQRIKGFEAAQPKLAEVEVKIHTESGDEPLFDAETECHDWWRCSKIIDAIFLKQTCLYLEKMTIDSQGSKVTCWCRAAKLWNGYELKE